MKDKIIALALVLIMVLPVVSCDSSDAYSEDQNLLVDKGNGMTEWISVKSAGSIKNTILNSLTLNGHTAGFDGTYFIVDGLKKTTIGGADSGGSLSTTGTTGITVESYWHIFSWDGGKWVSCPHEDTYAGTALAIAFYPDGIIPVETPEYKSSWTMMEKDAENSANTNAVLDTSTVETNWAYRPTNAPDALYGAALYAEGHAYIKYGEGFKGKVAVVSYDNATGTEEWRFTYGTATSMETCTELIAGQYIYVQSSNGQLYMFDRNVGPGIDNCNVTTINGEPWGSETKIPSVTATVVGMAWGSGPTTMVYDSGCIFIKSSNGMVYCFDSGLNLVWSYQTGGNCYFSGPTVYEDYVAAGMYDGHLYILDKHDGSLINDTLVYQTLYNNKKTGCVNVPIFVKDGDKISIMATFNEGRGISSKTFGMVAYAFDGTDLTQTAYYIDDFGGLGTYITRTEDGKGIYFNAGKGTFRMLPDGSYTMINDILKTQSTRSTPTLVNGKYLFFNVYSDNTLYQMDIDGTLVGSLTTPIKQFCMAPVTVVDGYILSGNDAGPYCIKGSFEPYIEPVYDREMTLLEKIAIALGCTGLTLGVFWSILRFGFKWEHPFAHLKGSMYSYLYGEEYTHNKRSKHKLGLILAFGILITLLVSLMSLCLGSETTLGPVEAIKSTFSAIAKGGRHLSYEEMLIYNARLPRTIAAIAVGIGLSVAGAVYQAVIKNPLVEPYIMGVSSGAGTLAVAVIAYDFTFFGLFDSQSPFLTACASIIGGLLAFGLTMLLAEKTGGKSTNYVLAGIVIGMVFGAVQSLLMILAGNNVASALSWLYGSFTTMTWQKVWLVLFPALTLSLVPLVWAKELNLVLLGEDQAKLMGLDAERFDRIMLILASILTAFCVAFCGIIGFVGLVIPHLCRMLLGGDHRLMLPASMAFGGFLMVLSDLLARILVTGYELPVGAITTAIGVPVFAYLLIRRGRSYDV